MTDKQFTKATLTLSNAIAYLVKERHALNKTEWRNNCVATDIIFAAWGNLLKENGK